MKKILWPIIILIVLFSIMGGLEYELHESTMYSHKCNSLAVDYTINKELDNLLINVPGAARVRVALINRNAETSANDIPFYRYAIVYQQTNPGHKVIITNKEYPLSLWSDFLPKLITNKIQFMTSDQVKDIVIKRRMEGRHLFAVLVVPIIDQDNSLMGALFLSWDDKKAIPSNITVVTNYAQISSTRISLILQGKLLPDLK